MENRKSSDKILITGAGGFIGGGLFEKLCRFNPIGVVTHAKGGIHHKNFIEADLRDEARVKEIFEKVRPNIVFHFAGFSSPKNNEGNPKLALDSNIGITNNIVKNLSENMHIIFPSTDKVFDGSHPNPGDMRRSIGRRGAAACGAY